MIAFTTCFDETGLTSAYRKCLDALQAHYGCVEIIRKVPEWYIPTGDYRYDSDVTRMDQLSKPGFWIYHDIDTRVKSDFVPVDLSKPYFNHRNGIPEIEIIISNKPDFFKWLIAEEQRLNMMRTFGMFQSLLYSNADKVNLIPGGHYLHYGLYQGGKNGST